LYGPLLQFTLIYIFMTEPAVSCGYYEYNRSYNSDGMLVRRSVLVSELVLGHSFSTYVWFIGLDVPNFSWSTSKYVEL